MFYHPLKYTPLKYVLDYLLQSQATDLQYFPQESHLPISLSLLDGFGVEEMLSPQQLLIYLLSLHIPHIFFLPRT